MINAYVASVQEAQKMLSVKWDNMTNMPCMRFNRWRETLELLTKAEMGDFIAHFKCFPLLAVSIVQVRRSWTHIGPHQSYFGQGSHNLVPTCLDIYRKFPFHLMTCFPLRVFRVLIVCLISLVRGRVDVSTAMAIVKGKAKLFNELRTSVPVANEAFPICWNYSSSYSTRVDYPKGVSGWRRPTGFFNNKGIVGKLEAWNYEPMDIVLPFTAANADLFRGLQCGFAPEAFQFCFDVINFV